MFWLFFTLQFKVTLVIPVSATQLYEIFTLFLDYKYTIWKISLKITALKNLNQIFLRYLQSLAHVQHYLLRYISYCQEVFLAVSCNLFSLYSDCLVAFIYYLYTSTVYCIVLHRTNNAKLTAIIFFEEYWIKHREYLSNVNWQSKPDWTIYLQFHVNSHDMSETEIGQIDWCCVIFCF